MRLATRLASYAISDEQGARKNSKKKRSGQQARSRSKQAGWVLKPSSFYWSVWQLPLDDVIFEKRDKLNKLLNYRRVLICIAILPLFRFSPSLLLGSFYRSIWRGSRRRRPTPV